jgi:hypothetical protein
MYRDEQFSRLSRSTYSFIYVINELNYLLKLEDGITPIEITEFVHTVIKMNSVMNFTIF